MKAASKDYSRSGLKSLEAIIRVAGINYCTKFLKLKTSIVKKYF